MWIAPTEGIRLFAHELQPIFAENVGELLLESSYLVTFWRATWSFSVYKSL